MDAIFVTKWQVAQKVFERVNAALGEKLGALRADSFQHTHVGLQAFGHRGFYTIGAEKARIAVSELATG